MTTEELNKRKNLISHILQHGRTSTWRELAVRFDLKDHLEAANVWHNHRIASKLPHASITPTAPNLAKRLLTEAEDVRKGTAYTMELEDKVTSYEENTKDGTARVEATVGQEIKCLEELVEKCKIDLNKWVITKWIQNFWNNKYQVKVFLSPKEEKNLFQENFVEFLKTYQAPAPKPIEPIKEGDLDLVFVNQGATDFSGANGCLLISKQDLHFDKHDINGSNSMHSRFRSYLEAVNRIVKKTELSYTLTEIVYLIGSDEFNCEWTGMTTKGTPQKNLIDYHNGFAAICDHEVEVIQRLIKPGRKVKVLYMPGNHDEYVGWHMITWLATYFRGSKEIEFNVSPSYTKYYKFGNTAMMFNHGDVMKPQKLAGIFPREFKEQWSECDYQYIFTGDKHHEMSLDIDGIIFYQLTQGSNATSKWDSKHGYQAKGFLTAFVVSERYGMADIYKERL